MMDSGQLTRSWQRTRARTPISKQQLRVCHLGKFYPPSHGGMETHVKILAHAQAALASEVRVVCINHDDGGGRDVSARALARTRTTEELDHPVRVTRVGKQLSVAKLDLCPRLITALASLTPDKVDVVHLHVPNPTMMVGLLPLRRMAPLIVTYHSDVVRQRMLGTAFRPIEDVILRRAKQIISNSPPYAEASTVLQRYRHKVTTLPMGLELAPFLEPSHAARKHAQELRQRHGDVLWLSVGRLVYYKGLQNAISALAHVPGTLLIIGQGPLEPELKRHATALGVADRVRFLGSVSFDELVGAYLAATALWFPSNARSEAFGLVQVEAMASGCPVINANVKGSGVPWVSRHDESGLTVNVDDPRDLAAAAQLLLKDPGLRRRLGEGGKARAQAEFSHTLMAKRMLELYRQLL